jgi:hypothetical protein
MWRAGQAWMDTHDDFRKHAEVEIIVARFDPIPKAVAIQVKTLKSQNRGSGWMIKKDNIEPDIFFVLVEMPEDSVPPKFFVLNSSEMMQFCDGHPTMNSVKIPKQSEPTFLSRWDRLMA